METSYVPNGTTTQSSLLLSSEIFNKLSLHLDDVELLQNAFIVQAVTSPLVRFSNRGRYEPYVAKSWQQSGNKWTFNLHSGLTCEDGEPITAESFKRSLERSLKKFSIEDLRQTPFFYLDKISTDDHTLEIHFKQSVGKAVLEYLAMTPFSYLCEANFSGDKWKSKDTFISSGPYKIEQFDASTNTCTLQLRKDWPLAPANAFERVIIANRSIEEVPTTAFVNMTYGLRKSGIPHSELVLEVPRALLSARLGIESGQFFSDLNSRRILQAEVNKILQDTNIEFENYHRAESFFFGQVSGHEIPSLPLTEKSSPPKGKLKVRGLTRGSRPEVDFYQEVIFQALDKLGWQYEVLERPIGTAKDFYNLSYDISFDRSHVDATLDPEFVRLLFKSKLGPRYQDPGQRVSNLVDTFDKGQMTYRDFLIAFNSIIAEEAAILPLFHRGFAFQFSPNIDVKSISPLMSILRYEELVKKK